MSRHILIPDRVFDSVADSRMACAGAFATCPGGGGDIAGLAVDIDEIVPRELRFGLCEGR